MLIPLLKAEAEAWKVKSDFPAGFCLEIGLFRFSQFIVLRVGRLGLSLKRPGEVKQ